MSTNDIDIMSTEVFKNNNEPIQRIKVIGVGGGGNNAVIHMHKQGIKDVSFVLLNTDKQVLDSASVPTKVLIGPGRGAGGNPERARKYAEESSGQIAELFDDQTDMVFITAGMGGGTGTGAGPVVARIAKEKGILTVGIVTLPFLFEGEKKVNKALEGAHEMAKNVDSLLIIDNQKLTEIYKTLNIFNAFAKADDTLLNATQSITDIITLRGVINRDFNDVDTTLREGGTAIISTGYGEGPNRVSDAIQDALHSPLLEDHDIFGSKKLLIVLYVSDEDEKYPFNMEEVKALEDFVGGIIKDVDVMWGLYRQPDLGNKVRITILASGFNVSVKTSNGQPEGPKGHNESGIAVKGSQPVNVKPLILDPAKYDDFEDETLNQLENEPALNRAPRYKTYHRLINETTRRETTNNDNPDKEDTPKPADKQSKSGGLILEFDDF